MATTGWTRAATNGLAAAILFLAVLGGPAPGHAAAPEISATHTALALEAVRFEAPLAPSGATSPDDDADLAAAIARYRAAQSADDVSALEDFLAAHPRSAWHLAVRTNLGLIYLHDGYFSRATDAFARAWDEGKSFTDLKAKALTDRAVGELLRMHARLGHIDALSALIQETHGRPLSGAPSLWRDNAREALAKMRARPDLSFLCGPTALKYLLLAEGRSAPDVAFLDDVRSGPDGTSLAEIAELATRAKLPFRLIRRAAGEPVPVPSIIHWKVNHFATIVGTLGDRYELMDSTFGQPHLWVTRAALDAESSGFFLVPTARQSGPWRAATADEAAGARGTGIYSYAFPGCTKCWLAAFGFGMTVAGYNEVSSALALTDTPVGYAPPIGPSVYNSLWYNHREASGSSSTGNFNVGSNWSFAWLAYIQDDPQMPGANVVRVAAGGGFEGQSGYNAATGTFAPDPEDASVLSVSTNGPVTYTRAMPDGSKEIYGLSNGGTGTTRYVYLTQIIDRFGNALTLCYNSGPNCGNLSPAQGPILLQSIIDANGLQTTFGYNNPNFPLQITSITDPYGRTATIGYDSAGRLTSITDIIGIVSSFAYDSPTGGHINQMTTPYGTTNFAYGGDEDEHALRWVQITDPLGYSERVEYPQIYTVAVSHVVPLSEPQNTLPQGMIGLANSTEGTYYWDKHMYALVGENWAQARSTTWAYSNFAVMSTTMASRREPLENRVWYNYPGQTAANGGTGVPGTLLKPTRIGRVLDDGTTQLYSRQYNALGNLTFSADPVGRVTTLQYAPNQIDVTRVQQVTGSGPATIASYTYNGQHLPLTATDAAGQTTTYTYNAAGQVTSVTDPLGETTSYAYDNLGNLLTVTNALGDTQASYTYDSYGRVATYTDSEGWTVGYAYDAFNRVTAEFYPDGTSRTYTYTNLDLTSVTDRQGRTTTYGYDANRELTSVTDPAGNVTQYSYYENGKLKTLTDADGHVTTWTIDLQSRITAKTDANGVTTNYTYENTTSRMRAATDPLGQLKLYSYKPDDQLAGIQYNNAVNPTPPVFFSYDPFFPRRQTMTDGSGTTTYSYNPVGALGALKLAQESPPFANSTIAYSYDALGRVASKSVGGDAETFAYDALGRLVTHTDDLGSFAQTYVGDTGQVTSRLANGIGTEWAYHGNFNDRRLKKIVNLPDNQKFGFVTTPENDITAITDDHKKETWSYSYDPADRLTAATSTQGSAYAYGYDPASNITSIATPAGTTIVTPTATNAVATAGSTAFRYDANGNLLADYARTYRWDAENRLIGIVGAGYSSSFTYDGLSRRIAVTTTSGGATGSTHYGWCGETLCQQRTSSDVPTRRYLPEGEYDVVQGALIYGIDQLGSVREVIAGATGLKTNTFDYDPYGSVTKATGSRATWTDFRYAGLFYHQPSGLYLATYRAYDPAVGRWVSRDPIAERGGINLYAYVGGNPLSGVDPFGLWTYSQATGTITDSNGNVAGQGYAGHGAGVNNPADQNQPNIGPLPQGGYTIGPQQNHTAGNGKALPGSMRLTPDAGNQMYGRGGFLIHGSNDYSQQNDSTGCIILPPAVRNAIGGSGDNHVTVVP